MRLGDRVALAIGALVCFGLNRGDQIVLFIRKFRLGCLGKRKPETAQVVLFVLLIVTQYDFNQHVLGNFGGLLKTQNGRVVFVDRFSGVDRPTRLRV